VFFLIFDSPTETYTMFSVHILSGDLILHKRTLGPVKALVYAIADAMMSIGWQHASTVPTTFDPFSDKSRHAAILSTS